MQTETFWNLVKSAGHWEFELFLMILFDVILGGIFYPFVRKHWQHHVDRDFRDRQAKLTPVNPFRFDGPIKPGKSVQSYVYDPHKSNT